MEIILGQEDEKQQEYIGNKLEDFEILQTLGKGSYGFVAKVKSKINQKIYALKMIDFSTIKDPEEKQLCLNEINILTHLNSPHIVKCYNFFYNGNKCYILMEYIDNGDLKGYINAHQNMKTPISENELIQIFYQCMSGLYYIHANNLIHRDIKPANIFLTNDKIFKIGDFGVSAIRKIRNTPNQIINIEKEKTMIGTPLYMSPEIFNQQKYGRKVDIYSMGCTFFEICYFTPPRIPSPVPKIINGKFEIYTDFRDVPKKENEGAYSQEITKIINCMIEKDQKLRPSTLDIFNLIKEQYNKRFTQNESIFCVYRCLFNFQKFLNSINKHSSKFANGKPISRTFSYALSFINNYNNLYNYLQKIRDELVAGNPCFLDPGEIEPKDLIAFILKKLHFENNNATETYPKLFCGDNDKEIFNKKMIFNKYMTYFKNFFKSFISGLFFGHFEINKKCLTCNQMRFYFESFSYLTIDVSEAIKNGVIINENFILNCFQKQFNCINKVNFCPSCRNQTNHLECKKIIAFPINLIIFIKYNEDKMNNQNIIYPINLSFSPIVKASFMLTGLNKRHIVNDKKYFVSIYSDSNKWILNDGHHAPSILQSPYEHSFGQVVVLFYNLINN